MHWVIWSALVIFFLVIQTVFGDVLTLGGVKPDILLVVTVFFAFKSLYFEAGILGFTCGLLQEGLSGCVLGANAFSKTVVALLIILVKKFYPAKCIPIGISIFLATCVNGLLIFILYSLFGTTINVLILVKRVILEGFYNLLIGIILFPFLSKLKWRGEK